MSISLETPKAPTHLSKAAKSWWDGIVKDFDLESSDLKLLQLAAESWDRGVQAREALAKHGLTYQDRFGAPRSRPEIAVERDSRISFARLMRELSLDIAPPAESRRPPKPRGHK